MVEHSFDAASVTIFVPVFITITRAEHYFIWNIDPSFEDHTLHGANYVSTFCAVETIFINFDSHVLSHAVLIARRTSVSMFFIAR